MKTKTQLDMLIERRRWMKWMYKRACERYWEIKTRVVAPEKEEIRQKILKRYALDKYDFNREVNELDERIFRMQKEGYEHAEVISDGCTYMW